MAFSLWDIFHCGCTTTTFPIHVSTRWCGEPAGCPAPGTITVTIKAGACPGGAVVATATAGPDGTATLNLPSGTYCATASTTAAGYLNQYPQTFTLPADTSVNTSLHPAVLYMTDSRIGVTVPVYPYGTMPPAFGTATGSDGLYLAASTITYHFGGGCGGCPAADVPMFYSYDCAGPGATSAFLTDLDPTGYICCPGDGVPGKYCGPVPQNWGVVGPGPGNPAPCWPMNQSVALLPGQQTCLYSPGDTMTVTQ